MANQSKKSIKASVMNEVRKEYEKKYEKKYKETFDRLKSDNKYYNSENKLLFTENQSLKEEIIRLKDENEKLKDWNQRMMAFMDMPEEERNEAIKADKIKRDLDKRLSGVINMFAPYFDSIGY